MLVYHYKNVIKKAENLNTMHNSSKLLKVKQEFISSIDHCDIYIKGLIQITALVLWFSLC